MSQFYDLASLVVIPSGYKASTIYAQKPLTTDGQLSFTRASTATRVNASGLIEAVSSNVPRLDYTNSSCPRLLLEPQRTNIATQSNNYTTFAKSANTGITLNSATSPDGTNNATLVYCINTSTNAFIAQGFTGSSSTLYTVSFYAKKKELDLVYLKNVNDTGGQSFFNLTTGVATLVSGLDSVSMTAVGNGWYRCVAKSTSSSTNVQWVPIIKGNANQGLYIYGLQIEAGAYETSLIPTSGTAVTRVGELVDKNGIASLIGGTSGTVFFEIKTNTTLTNANYKQFFYYKDSSTGQAYLYLSPTNNVRTSPTLGNITSSITLAANTVYKVAIAYASNDFKLYINGVERGSSTSGTPIDAVNILSIGSLLGTSEFNEMTFSKYLHFKSRLTNAQLAELTTL